MTQQFENFVNAALDKSLASDVTLPTANEIPVYTGIGRQVTGKTPTELGLASSSDITTKADLVDGVVPSSQLPSYVDDVLEYPNLASFPATGESGKVYVALDTNKTYRWSGSTYVVIGSDLALGDTLSTAYRGDRGKTAYDHSQATGNPHGATTANINDSTDKRYVTDAQRTRVNTAASSGADGYLTSTDWSTFNGKQAALTSGANIKTINGNNILGSGDLAVTDPAAVQRGTGNTVNATSEVVNCTNVTVNGTDCLVSNSKNLSLTGNNLTVSGVIFGGVRVLTFPEGSVIVGSKNNQGCRLAVKSTFMLTKPDSGSVVVQDSSNIKPYVAMYYYGSTQDVAYHKITVMGRNGDNNYKVFVVAARKDTSITTTVIEAGGNYINLTAVDDGAGRLTLTLSTTYTNQDTLTVFVDSFYGNKN